MKEMLRKRELIEAVNVPKSTVSDWIVDFRVFIPTTQVGSTTYYLPQAIDVLLEIKRLRELQYSKPEIMKELSRLFPITVEDPSEISTIIQERQGFQEEMEQIKLVIRKSAEQMQEHSTRLEGQNERIELHQSKIDQQTEEIIELKSQLDVVIKELASTKEQLQQSRKKWWQRLF